MLKAKVSDAELEKMIADIANGVMYSISWPNKTQLAVSLQKCRTKSAAEVLRLKDRIAELEAAIADALKAQEIAAGSMAPMSATWQVLQKAKRGDSNGTN